MSNIAWTNDKRRLTQLIPWPRNPRYSKGKTAQGLQESFEEFGQPETICIGPSNEVYNGHQRLSSWLSSFGDIEIDVRVSSRPLSEKEREKLTIVLHAGAVGDWNWDDLSGWDATDLISWGLDDSLLDTWRRDVAALGAMVGSEQPDIDLSQFFEQVTEDYEAKQGFDRIILEYTSDDAAAVKQAFAELEGTPEQIVWELLGL